MGSGIYQITNLTTGKKYVGSAVNLKARWKLHKINLCMGQHHNKHLQAAWVKYGESDFVFKVLMECPREDLIKTEQLFIDNLVPEYNMCRVAGSALGLIRSYETRRKLSDAHKRKTPEQKKEWAANISKAKAGAKLSDERKAQMSKYMTGRPSPMAGKPVPIETRAKQSESAKKRKATLETRQKMAEGQRNRSAESRAKAAESNRGKKRTNTQRAVTSEMAKKQWAGYRDRKEILKIWSAAL